MADTLHHLIVTRVGEVATIALDRPPVNAVDLRVIDEFHEQRPEAKTKWAEERTMSRSGTDGFRFVRTDDLAWRPSTMGAGIFVRDVGVTDGWEMQIVRVEPGARFPVHTHAGPEFLFVLEGELLQAGQRLGPGWASVASAGTVDGDVRSETGCTFVLVDRA